MFQNRDAGDGLVGRQPLRSRVAPLLERWIMLNAHLVRVGILGQVGRFAAATGEIVPRGRRVICRTARGLEVGQVLATPGDSTVDQRAEVDRFDGTLLRRMTAEDDLVVARLEKNREQAFAACADLLDQRQLTATLVDVEPLFDGTAIYFYFLGEVTPEIDAVTRDLAEEYEAKVQLRQFADALERGCGPDCGTEAASGGGCGTGCGSCSIASACHDASTRRQ